MLNFLLFTKNLSINYSHGKREYFMRVFQGSVILFHEGDFRAFAISENKSDLYSMFKPFLFNLRHYCLSPIQGETRMLILFGTVVNTK